MAIKRAAKHGTTNTYNKYGCRCDPCKEAKSAYEKKLRETPSPVAKAVRENLSDPRHGSEYVYSSMKCRCDKCKLVHNERVRASRRG